MDNTLDSIRPSSVNTDEMSYLFGRDPSILAYGQRPHVCLEAKKNLLSLYEIEEGKSIEESTSSSSIPDYLQTVKVYLRMKPFPRKIKLSKDQEEAYSITNSTTLLTRLPSLDKNASYLNKTKGSGIVCKKYTFTKTFGPETTQLELFDQAIKQKMTDFLAGQNCTVMTYGTTNSGKSYTLQGTISSPGIIPRALEFVFSNITPKTTPLYKPAQNNDVIALDALQQAQELEEKAKLLSFVPIDKNQHINAYTQMQQLLQEESPLRPSQCTDAHFSVWVSFAEIYNETIYDLLSNKCQKEKPPMKLVADSEGRAFIKGLKMVCVNSGSEAYQVLMAGQYNLKVAATALNARSSRSHCIFTIKLLKYHTENKPETVEVSTFAFCDLAGSERLKKTLNIGDRLKEAQNINTSLLVLGKCLKYVYEGQCYKQRNEHIGPFRESKLTRLFQMALSGKEHMALIVNVNPVPNLYIETQNVLTFSAIAKRIVIEPKKVVKRKSKTRFSQAIAHSIKTVTDWDSADLVNIDEEPSDIEDTQVVDDDIYNTLMDKNENLEKEIAALKNSMLERDMQIRREMADKYSTIIKQIEEDWKNRVRDVEARQEDTLESTVKQVEEFYEQKLSQITSHKRRRENDYDEDKDDDKKAIEELETENSYLTSKVESLKDIIRKLKDEKKSLIVEKNQIGFECSLVKDELKNAKDLLKATRDLCPDNEKVYIEELESQLSSEREKRRKLKIFLDEAKCEYIDITNDAREKEEKIKQLEETILHHVDRNEELKSYLDNANTCLIEKTNTIEMLENKLELQSKKLLEMESKSQTLEKRVHEESCQTSNVETQDQINQTSFIENTVEDQSVQTSMLVDDENDTVKDELATLTTKYDDLERQYKEECSKIEELSIELGSLRGKVEELQDESNTKSFEIEEYKSSVAMLKEDLNCVRKQKDDVEEELKKMKEVKSELHEESGEHSCEYTSKVTVLEEELSRAKEASEIKAHCVEAHEERIFELEQKLGTVQDLHEQIINLNEKIDTCQKEKEELERLLDKNNRKLEEYEDQLDKAQHREQEKDEEIKNLQKEIKHMIQSHVSDDKVHNMEIEMKKMLKELIEVRETVVQKDELIQSLESRQNAFKQNAKIVELLEKSAQDRQMENDRLRSINEELKNSLLAKESEMESFKKNRDETITKYEGLVKSQQEELERQKREVMRFQELFLRQTTPTPSKDEVKKLKGQIKELEEKLKHYENYPKSKEHINISDDEVPLAERRGRDRGRRKKENFLSPNKIGDEIQVIELSGSESKRSTRRTALPPPTPGASTETKRTTRKKKLFIQTNESLEDVEPSESMQSSITLPSPISAPRSLRSRRK